MATTTSISREQIEQNVNQLNEAILNGKALEAFEELYAEDVVMSEPGVGEWEGKDTNREREQDFMSKVTEFRGFEVKNVAVGDGVSMVECSWDYTHEEWGEMNYTQVAVQEWNDEGLITRETFYHA
ncbi:MAG: nuclear transport factor 2 family protein [Bacteroidota bacterium]